MKKAAPIAATEIRFRSLLEQTPELILYQDENSTILDANPAFLAHVGLTMEQVLNRPCDAFLPPEVRVLFREKLAEAFCSPLAETGRNWPAPRRRISASGFQNRYNARCKIRPSDGGFW